MLRWCSWRCSQRLFYTQWKLGHCYCTRRCQSVHNLVSGRSIISVLHLLNVTPIGWYSKLQTIVKTATFGSQCVAACTATEQIIDLQLTACHLGVPIDVPSFMFGDNKSVINTASVSHSKLHKRHNALFYHWAHKAIAAGITRFHNIVGTTNPVDILSKHWGHSSIWEMLYPFMFWQDDPRATPTPWFSCLPTSSARGVKAGRFHLWSTMSHWR